MRTDIGNIKLETNIAKKDQWDYGFQNMAVKRMLYVECTSECIKLKVNA